MSKAGNVALVLGVAGLSGLAGLKIAKSAGLMKKSRSVSEEDDDTPENDEELFEGVTEWEIDEDESREYFQLLIALFAVHMACAALKGTISAEETQKLILRLAGIGYTQFPVGVTETFAHIVKNPPAIPQALEYGAELFGEPRVFFDSMVKEIMPAGCRTDGQSLSKSQPKKI